MGWRPTRAVVSILCTKQYIQCMRVALEGHVDHLLVSTYAVLKVGHEPQEAHRLKTIATFVNYTCKSFIEMTPGVNSIKLLQV